MGDINTIAWVYPVGKQNICILFSKYVIIFFTFCKYVCYTMPVRSSTPYTICGDLHTHTMVSQHAYSTINELVQASLDQGFTFLAVTDHGPETFDGAISHHFLCMNGLPHTIGGVTLYTGAEVNIKDFKGRIDLPPAILRNLDFTIASFHIEAIKPGTIDENTEAWLSVIRNPFVDCLGHPGNPVFPFRHEPVVRALKEAGKIFEINANSFPVRKGSETNCRDMITLAERYGVPMVATSDAHVCYNVGNVEASLVMLHEQHVPEGHILNTSEKLISAYIERRKAEKAQAFHQKEDIPSAL